MELGFSVWSAIGKTDSCLDLGVQAALLLDGDSVAVEFNFQSATWDASWCCVACCLAARNGTHLRAFTVSKMDSLTFAGCIISD